MTRGSQAQQGEKLGQVDQSFGLGPFPLGQRLAGVLAVEEIPQASGDRPRQSEPGQIGGEIDFDGQGQGASAWGCRAFAHRADDALLQSR